MKGLLLKDYYVLMKQSRLLLLLLVVYTFLASAGTDSFGAFTVLFISMLPMTLMGIDEKHKWENLAVTMPYRKSDFVISKYLIVVVMLFFTSLFYACARIVMQLAGKHFEEMFSISYITLMLSIGLLYPALLLPLMFRLGVEKARLWFLVITAALGGGIGAFFVNKSTVSFDILYNIMNKPWAILIMDVLIFLLSAALSVRLYEKREF
ncbi:ABC-2 transporter permease [Anaerocolumna sp. AGMB13020]|uniref:ABC-2 transporter permease n=1 Tax=Anaerocolumna sp. AGMB13020 TaxID=3081750 RepID=UPI00295530EF|nr:ABC-2 transporter permease [Anaerocolumna sp. AGMB13020]WOO38049.1 ABC-2 transporter permease [Anaerocolumna sp. AGMB13020]